MKIFKYSLFFLLAIIFSNCDTGSEYEYVFQDPNADLESRVDDLLSQMTVEEKISQMKYDAPAIERLGVPSYNWWNECLHGVGRAGEATVFPQAIGMAATWNQDLMHQIATAISDEARAKHHQFAGEDKRGIYMGLTFWTPNINIFRDPRWGRGQETYGEDPYLTGTLATQFIKGLQGDHEKYLKLVATSKHFAVHSGPESLRHSMDAKADDHDLYETYLPAFKRTVFDANVQSIMCAYNSYRDKPCCGSDMLLTSILRNDWGFDGYVVSDCWAINDFYMEGRHNVVDTEAQAASMAVKSGTDINCGNTFPYLQQAVEQGLISEDELDVSLRRLFRARFKLGMFDPAEQVEYAQIPYDVVTSQEHLDLALQTSRESIVLLKNENNTLPLDDNINSIAVIGPNADDNQVMLGNYHGTPTHMTTVLAGISEKLPDAEINFAKGTHWVDGFPILDPVPSSALTNEQGDEKGLYGQYYDNQNWEGEPVQSRVDPNIDFFWTGVSPLTGAIADTFSIRWSGNLVAPVSGTYEIALNAGNSGKLIFEGEEKFSFDNTHHPTTNTFTTELQAGESYPIQIDFYNYGTDPQAHLMWHIPGQDLESEAMTAARNSDVVVMVMGLHPRIEGEEMGVELPGFSGGDRTDIKLPEIQSNLIRKIQGLGKPTVLVLLGGSAVAFNWENDNLPAIIYGWYPGEFGGQAIADVLFGDYNPSGKLPVTFYKSVDDLPPFEDYDMDNRTYKYFTGEPLYPFGYGMSYTTFEYEDLQMPESINSDQTMTVSVKLTNSGPMDGEEVVQLYVKDLEASDQVPIRVLGGYQKVSLAAGETKTVNFEITPEQLANVTQEGKYVVEPGDFEISIGGEQPGFSGMQDVKTTGTISGTLTVTGENYLVQ